MFSLDIADLENRLPYFSIPYGIHLINGPADHHLHQLLLRCLICRFDTHQFSVPQNHYPVGNFKNLVQVMGNVNNRLSVFREFPDNGKQYLYFLFIKGRCRFIHNENMQLQRNCLGYFHQLLFRYSQSVELIEGVVFQTDLF